MIRSHQFLTLWVVVSSLASAGSITISQINAAPAFENFVAGEFQLSQTGNEITGSYQLNQAPPDGPNEYEIVRPSDHADMGQFVLQETGNLITGDFVLSETGITSTPVYETDYNALLETNLSDTIGTVDLIQQQAGNNVTGNYYLVTGSSGATAPEPASFAMFAIGAGLIVFSRAGRLGRFLRSQLLA